MMKVKEPLEHDEQVDFVRFLNTQNLQARIKGLEEVVFSAIANGHYQSSINQRRKLKREGMNSGVPDMVLIVPSSRSKTGKAFMLWIEMKRQTQGSLSASQKKWIDAINSVNGTNMEAFVCRGADEAKKVYDEFAIVFEFVDF